MLFAAVFHTINKKNNNTKNSTFNYTVSRIRSHQVTSALAGFHAGPLIWWNWNLEMLVFMERGKLENPKKNPSSKAEINKKVNPHIRHQCTTPESNPGHIILLGAEPSRHCTIPAWIPDILQKLGYPKFI